MEDDSEPKTLVDGGRACESSDGGFEETCFEAVDVDWEDDEEDDTEGEMGSLELASLSRM